MTAKGYTTSKLIEAIRAGRLSGVINALDEGADIEMADIHGHRGLPLRTACFEGNLGIVRELLAHGANVNASASDGPGAPLRLASRKGHDSIVALLLQEGARIPEGFIIAAQTFDIASVPLSGEAVTPSLPAANPDNEAVPTGASEIAAEAGPDSNIIEFTPSYIPPPMEDTDSPAHFGTETNALSMELLFLEENEAHNAWLQPQKPATTKKDAD